MLPKIASEVFLYINSSFQVECTGRNSQFLIIKKSVELLSADLEIFYFNGTKFEYTIIFIRACCPETDTKMIGNTIA